MDQSAPNHTENAFKCLESLLDRQQEFIGISLEVLYWNSISFELFHIAQQKAFMGGYKEAKSFLSQSLEVAFKGISDEWLSYIKGTKCYFDGNLKILQKEISTAGENGVLLMRLFEGYKKRGSVNYTEDYGGI